MQFFRGDRLSFTPSGWNGFDNVLRRVKAWWNKASGFAKDEPPFRGELLSLDLLRQYARNLAENRRVEERITIQQHECRLSSQRWGSGRSEHHGEHHPHELPSAAMPAKQFSTSAVVGVASHASILTSTRGVASAAANFADCTCQRALRGRQITGLSAARLGP